jgi:hypothetical protein
MERTQGGLLNRIPTWSDVHASGASPRALALQAWLIEPQQRLGPAWQEPFVNGLADLLAAASVDDCVYAGFEFDPAREPLRGTLVDQGCLVSVEFSGGGDAPGHRAVCIAWMDDIGAHVWIDGMALPVPIDETGSPQANPHATGWCAGRYYFVEIGGLFGHPLSDPDAGGRMGNVRGLLAFDAQRRVARLEYPSDSELWTSPRPSVESGNLRIHATRDALAAGTPARVITLHEAFGGESL